MYKGEDHLPPAKNKPGTCHAGSFPRSGQFGENFVATKSSRRKRVSDRGEAKKQAESNYYSQPPHPDLGWRGKKRGEAYHSAGSVDSPKQMRPRGRRARAESFAPRTQMPRRSALPEETPRYLDAREELPGGRGSQRKQHARKKRQ